jgi:RNA polymerase sigma factor (TIGR02999 family)
MSEVTQILAAIERGERQASEALLPLVYDELRALAANNLRQEGAGQTLDATGLVHEAYLRLVTPDGDADVRWDHRGHFFAAAAEAMRRILVENARRKRSMKHGGGRIRVDITKVNVMEDAPGETILALDDALNRLAAIDSQKAELVKLRFFAGLTIEQAAKALDISPATAGRHWLFARAWLHRALNEGVELA